MVGEAPTYFARSHLIFLIILVIISMMMMMMMMVIMVEASLENNLTPLVLDSPPHP